MHPSLAVEKQMIEHSRHGSLTDFEITLRATSRATSRATLVNQRATHHTNQRLDRCDVMIHRRLRQCEDAIVFAPPSPLTKLSRAGARAGPRRWGGRHHGHARERVQGPGRERDQERGRGRDPGLLRVQEVRPSLRLLDPRTLNPTTLNPQKLKPWTLRVP